MTPPIPPFTVDELAATLRLHRETIVRMLRAGEFPGAIKVGRGRGRWRIPAVVVDAYLETHSPRRTP